ncbi:MAG: NAD(P)-dependent oxidoreductase [Candidatus Peribacteraceae bacterium]
MKYIFLEVDPVDTKVIQAHFPDAVIVHEALSGTELVKACRDADVVSCFIYSPFTKDVITKLPKLKLLCTRSVGTNHIDRAACDAQGIRICNVPDYGSHVIAEHVFALLLSALRHISVADKRVEEGQFDYHGLRGMALRGKTIGIVGTGKIGTRAAEMALGFGMRVIAVDQCRVLELEKRGVLYTDIETLERESDIITLHVPLLPETEHMINAASIKRMKQGVIIVNTARGELIDSAALLEGLKFGKVARALLDVLEHEKDVAWNQELVSHPNVIVTPHIAFYADQSMERMYEDCFASIEEYTKGKPLSHEVKDEKKVCDLPGVRKA